ncbi:MAG TPA: hypothetical protein VKB72_01710 [Steroidobacteraceae bacterium]|nr:hypothetical protein [Steroidobacteraceae bacterium]
MDTTKNGPGGDATTLRAAARDAARRAQATGNIEVEELCADVEELIKRIGQPADPNVAHLCARVAEAVANARQALNTRATLVQRQARDVFVAGDAYVREQPWQAIGTAAVVGVLIGLLAFRR